MNRIISIEGDIKFQRYTPNDWELIILVKNADVIPLCMEMCLLEYKRAEFLIVKSKTTPETTSFSVFDDPNKERRIHLDRMNDKFKVKLTFNGLQYIIAYLLEYYRDSYAAASHIHLEVSEKSTLGRGGDLTIVAEKSAKPISGEEAKRILKNK